ncbi:hypothetical protein [Symmachiella dynata]|nr:hypothetical protein [Symmachiella dynata]
MSPVFVCVPGKMLSRHLDANVVASPYVPEQLAAIAVGELPARPW